MKPGFKFSRLTIGFTALLCCSWCVVPECSAVETFFTTEKLVGVLGVFSTILAGSHHASGLPPSLFQKRLGSPMPQIGRPISVDEDEDSDEDEEDLLDDESRPRVEPHITPLNRDQCLAKLLCGMSVPVTGGTSKKNYYSEYANIVSKFFEAFPLDDEFQSKESIETYDDYSTEDDGKPIRTNNRRKPLNSSRVEATAPTLQLFDLALVDIAKPEDMTKNRTRKAAFEKVSTGNRIARARKIVENLGQKLQTVRQCQSIAGCPFSFKQLREKIKKKENQRVNSNVPLQPGPVWPVSPKRNQESSGASYQPKPYAKPQSRPRPIPPTPKPESTELFSPEEPVFPFKDTHKGDDEMEEIFGPAPVSKKPMGYHQGVDEQYNYEYNPDKPWRPGATEDNSYSHRPWKPQRPRPQPKPFSRPNTQQHYGQRPPPSRPRPAGGPPGSRKRYPQQQQSQNRRPGPTGQGAARPPPPRPKKPAPATTTTTTTRRPLFPKKKISYLNSPYQRPGSSGEDDEGNEDINKVAPVELIGNADAQESEPVFKKPTTTAKPEETTETTTSKNKKKKKDDDDSDEYDDDDYDDDYEDDALDEDEDEYSDEEADDKEAEAKKKKEKKKKETKDKRKKKKEVIEEKDQEEEEDEEEDEKVTTKKAKTTTTAKPKKKVNLNQYFDDETEDVHEIWTKLNYATTGAMQKPLGKLKKKEKTKITGETAEASTTPASAEEEETDADEAEADESEEDEEEVLTISGLPSTRTSSTSASDEADDEVDDENASKRKRTKYRAKSKSKKKVKTEQSDEEEEVADDIVEKLAVPTAKSEVKPKDDKKPKKEKKNKKKKKQTSSEEEDARRKQIMLEIGGRPLVPKPDQDQTNTKKTTSLIGNRFKFQFINPYGPAPPSDENLPGAYTPMRSSFGPTPAASSPGSSYGSAAASAVSSLPFKFKLNPGALGNLAGGAGIVPLGGFPSMGSSSSASGSLEMPDPNHPPPPAGYFPPPPSQKSQSSHHQQRQEQFGHYQPSLSGLGGSSLSGSGLFRLNPLPALTNLFKRPSSSSGFDPMNGPDGPPPANAFVHRPIGPESSHYNRKRPSPASGSSNPASSSSTGGASKKSSKSKSSSKGRKEKISGPGVGLKL